MCRRCGGLSSGLWLSNLTPQTQRIIESGNSVDGFSPRPRGLISVSVTVPAVFVEGRFIKLRQEPLPRRLERCALAQTFRPNQTAPGWVHAGIKDAAPAPLRWLIEQVWADADVDRPP
jgi:hypothetical protein